MQILIPTLLRIKPNAMNKLGKYLRKENFKRIALFYGEGIRELFDETIKISLDSSEIRVEQEVVVDDNLIEAVFDKAFSLPGDIDAVVAIGGGKVIDFAKYIGFVLQLPMISVPTALSHDGMASPGASLKMNGRRKSLKAQIPFGVVIDTKVIKESPQMFTLSGVGDLVSKFTAIYDWKKSFYETGEPVNDFSVLISMNSVENLVNYGNKDLADLEFLRLVAGCLVMSGVAMEVSQSSRPASGSEHLISHAYDMAAGQPSQHGIQVGVATIATAWLQENNKQDTIKQVLEETGFIAYVENHPLDKAAFIEAVKTATSIKKNYFTVLSEPGAVPKLLEHVENDSYLNRLLQ